MLGGCCAHGLGTWCVVLTSLHRALGCTQGRVSTLWPVSSSLDQMSDAFVLNLCIKLWMAAGTMALGVPAQALGPSLEFCPAGQMRLGSK